MLSPWIMAVVAAAAAFAIAFFAWPVLRKKRRERRELEAHQMFYRRREWLEAKCLTLAAQSGKPRGLAWADCDFDNDVAFARDRRTGQLSAAMVGVTISFEAIEGGGMEDVEAVANLRSATAVFRFDGAEWFTDGRVVFNLSPRETIQHFRHELETSD